MAFDRSILKAALIAGGALLYGASPLDIVPEFLAGPLGFGDDALVMVAAGVAIFRILRKRQLERRAAQTGPASSMGQPSPSPTATV